MHQANRILFSCLFALLGAVAGNANSAVIYQYTSAPYDQDGTPPRGFLGQRMSVALTFASLLPGNATALSVCPSGCAATVLDFVADGGLPNFDATSANGGQMLPGNVSTDAAGNIVAWTMTFTRLSFALVATSTSHREVDLPVATFDHGEILNTHWGSTTTGTWSIRGQEVDSPGTLPLLALGLLAILGRPRRAMRA
jgi:uncharacterized protein (TIGR03382 family)